MIAVAPVSTSISSGPQKYRSGAMDESMAASTLTASLSDDTSPITAVVLPDPEMDRRIACDMAIYRKLSKGRNHGEQQLRSPLGLPTRGNPQWTL